MSVLKIDRLTATTGAVVEGVDLRVIDEEVVAEIRERTGRAIPVLFVTGNADFQVPRWPAVGLLRKPFELHELGERVADLLAANRD